MKKNLLFGFLFCLVALRSLAQTTTNDIKGFVYDKATGEPVIFTNVLIQGSKMGAQTDVNGFFSIKKVPVGNYNIIITYLGYDSLIKPITVTTGQVQNLKLYLEKKARVLKGTVISAKRQEKQNDVKIGETKITSNQIKSLPSIGGEPDLAQYLSVLPGVVSSGDQGGQIYIRGGAPIQNKVYLDGMPVYNPFHSLGLFSVFETDVIKNANVKTAGFNAENGGATSAIVDVTTRDGNKKNYSGKVSVNPFASKFLFEGPISKIKSEDGGGSSFIITAKNSYLNKTSPVIYPYTDSTGYGLPFSFTDLFGKASFSLASGSKINLFGFNFRDKAQFLGTSEYKWNSSGAGGSFVVTPAGSTVLINGMFAYSNYGLNLLEADSLPRSSTIGGFTGHMDFDYTLPKNSHINYGIDISGFKTTYHFANVLKVKYQEDQNTTELAGFLKYKKIAGPLVIEPGFRIVYYASLNQFSPEPRIGMKYNASSVLRFKAAAGRYSQNLLSTKSDRDVVNLFTGFLSGPEVELKDVNGNRTENKLQTAYHAVGGIEYDLTEHIELNAETFIKSFTQLININRNKFYPSDPNYMIETGRAYGGDFSCKIDYKQIYIWAVYSLGYVDRYDGTKDASGKKVYYAPPFDRRHNINLLGTYTFGSDLTWEAGARWNFGSGFPFTLTQGFYEQYSFGAINSNYLNQNGQLGIIYDEKLNAGRLPYYHRLDLSLKKKFYLAKRSILEANASVTNAYNRANIFYFDRVRYTRVNQLPILPAIGLTFTF